VQCDFAADGLAQLDLDEANFVPATNLSQV